MVLQVKWSRVHEGLKCSLSFVWRERILKKTVEESGRWIMESTIWCPKWFWVHFSSSKHFAGHGTFRNPTDFTFCFDHACLKPKPLKTSSKYFRNRLWKNPQLFSNSFERKQWQGQIYRSSPWEGSVHLCSKHFLAHTTAVAAWPCACSRKVNSPCRCWRSRRFSFCRGLNDANANDVFVNVTSIRCFEKSFIYLLLTDIFILVSVLFMLVTVLLELVE